jgi:hypothetical protein
LYTASNRIFTNFAASSANDKLTGDEGGANAESSVSAWSDWLANCSAPLHDANLNVDPNQGDPTFNG